MQTDRNGPNILHNGFGDLREKPHFARSASLAEGAATPAEQTPWLETTSHPTPKTDPGLASKEHPRHHKQSTKTRNAIATAWRHRAPNEDMAPSHVMSSCAAEGNAHCANHAERSVGQRSAVLADLLLASLLDLEQASASDAEAWIHEEMGFATPNPYHA